MAARRGGQRRGVGAVTEPRLLLFGSVHSNSTLNGGSALADGLPNLRPPSHRVRVRPPAEHRIARVEIRRQIVEVLADREGSGEPFANEGVWEAAGHQIE